jgi:Tol biopolymer transport system component
VSNSSNLHPDSTDGIPHLYMSDKSDNSLSILDRKPDGTVGSTNASWAPQAAMSCDGSLIAFQYPGSAGGLVAGDTSSQVNVYLLDRRGNTDKISNLTATANSAAMGPSISCNGDFIGFKSRATNLDPSVSMTFGSNTYRPFIYDRVNGVYHLAAITTSNTAIDYSQICGASADTSPCVQISDTGVGVFAVDYPDLTGVSGKQIYLRDIYSGTTELISKNSSGVASNTAGYNGKPTISSDSKIVVYGSDASNLVTGDSNNAYDVFTSLTGY